MEFCAAPQKRVWPCALGTADAAGKPQMRDRKCGLVTADAAPTRISGFHTCDAFPAGVGMQMQPRDRRSGFHWAEIEKIEDLKFITSKIKLELGGRQFCGVFEEKINGSRFFSSAILSVRQGGFRDFESHYIEKMLKRFNCFDVAFLRTPYDPRIHFKKKKESSISQTEYAKIIGSVIFLMNYTRPDIAYVVSRLRRYTHNPSSEHWIDIHRFLRYLRGTISWKSSKQTCIAQSTMESEFIALEIAGQEAE
uniref:Uncharacterized protein LOC104217815 n=1 Tax=Nicotiana sylvestris TaxID=4096 RepID=A0A1U7VWW8_NICSY|nr:PREDICTED: uncharacterized protein LOC104217815 [Nicotiana sylvestris]